MEEEKKYEREKIAVVTGGVRGIGLGISLALKKKGYRVYALYSKDEKSAAAAQGEGVIPVKADVRNEAEIVAFFSVLRHVDVLVNNAGIAVAAQLQDTSAEMLDELYAENLVYFKTLSVYIEMGKKKLEAFRANDVEAARQLAERTGLPEDAQAAKDLADKAERFETDRRNGRYNVFVVNELNGQAAAIENARRQALAAVNDLMRAYKMLDLKLNDTLLNNIMILGLQHAVYPLEQDVDTEKWEIP